MSQKPIDETRAFWNRVAPDWEIQTGDEGDANRRLNSDPVLWELLGDVRGLSVLDAGCGTGYLTRLLAARGARAIGVDLAERMIAIARTKAPELDFRVGSCSDLFGIEDATIDLVVSNYVLMDTPDLDGALRSFRRVLKPRGAAVVVFSHPCFPQGRAARASDGTVRYEWGFGYFEQRRVVDPPWGHFRDDFLWFHRPLSDYWKAFRLAGFEVEELEEPRVTPERYHLAESPKTLENSRSRPYSIAFRLRKP